MRGSSLELRHLLLDKHVGEQLELIEGAMLLPGMTGMSERSWYD